MLSMLAERESGAGCLGPQRWSAQFTYLTAGFQAFFARPHISVLPERAMV